MMTPERWATAKEVFSEAQELAPDERAAHSRRRIVGDTELLGAVLSLLEADESVGDFLQESYIAEAPDLFKHGRSLLGEVAGTYRLNSLIVEAGSCSLYRASRLDGLIRRDVAVKVYWTEARRSAPPKRLLAEMSALTSIDHHGVCRLYDVIPKKTEAFCEILEWIDGENIKAFCDRRRMPVKERVQLLLSVLEAMAEVHACGYLHGDIKEEHVLVTPQLRTKLIDFGSARIVGRDIPEESAAVLDFTPEYASPELLRGEHLDSRSDIYSFGILMYRVLVGRHPHGIRFGLITEIADFVLNEEPQSALTVLSTANPSDFAERMAAQRSVSISRLRAIFSSDLALIMLRAIQKERKDRYQSVSDLAQDLRLWLGNRPTVAGTFRERMLSTDSSITTRLRAFLCHCSEDKSSVRELGRQLRALGVTTWLDEDDLLPGQQWQEEIPKAVAGADVVIVCLSEHSLTKTGFIQKEIRFALDIADEQPPGHIFIIPVRLTDCDVPDRLKKWQWVNLFEDQGFNRLAKALRFQSERVGSPM